MTPEQRCIAIAKACPDLFWIYRNPLESAVTLRPPAAQIFRVGQHPSNGDAPCDLLNDLNAMHEAVRSLSFSQAMDWVRHLRPIVGWDENATFHENEWKLATATAAQRAEAFRKTLNLKDEQ